MYMTAYRTRTLVWVGGGVREREGVYDSMSIKSIYLSISIYNIIYIYIYILNETPRN